MGWAPTSSSSAAPPPALSNQDLRYLTGYLSSIYSIAVLRLSWLVALPRIESLSNEPLYFVGYVPCRRVQALGLLVGVSVNDKRVVYTLDDGSGATVECMAWARQGELGWCESRPFEVGQTVSLVGRIDEYKGIRQLTVESIQLERNPNAESQHMLRCAMLHQTKYRHPFSIAAEMARVTHAFREADLSMSQQSQLSVLAPGPPSSQPSLDTTADFSSASYASSDPVSEFSYASYSQLNLSISLSQTLKRPQQLRKPSSLPDSDMNETTLRIYVVAYFKRHSEQPCSAQSLHANEPLKRLAYRIGERRGKVLRNKITGFARSSKSSSTSASQESRDRKKEREELNLRLFRDCLGAVLRDGIIVEAPEAHVKGSKTNSKEFFYELFHPEMLEPVVKSVLQMLSANHFVKQNQGVSESTLVAEVHEADSARWHYISSKEIVQALEKLKNQQEACTRVVTKAGQSRWLWSEQS